MATLIWSILALRSTGAGAEGSDHLWRIAAWGAALIGIVLALGIGIVLARRRYLKFRAPVSEGKDKGFGIEQVESLHDSGQISDQEFRILRNVALGLDSAVAKKDNSPLSQIMASDDENSDKGEEEVHTDVDKEQE
jgi:hypothetical protein